MTLLNPDSHICIVGCGLIGGSFALALRRAGFKGRLTAWDNETTIRFALERGVIDAPEDSFTEGVSSTANLVFLATPIGGIIDFMRRHRQLLRPGTLVTDAGSTKVEICRLARQSLPLESTGIEFIGGHPMAGSEHSGIEYARADLFDRATWALVDEPDCSPGRLAQLTALIEVIGARPLSIGAAEHDRAVALVSHLPQLLASTLATLLLAPSPDQQDPEGAESRQLDLSRRMAASGWRDMTRLAGSSFNVWRDIIMTNQPEVLRILTQYLAELQQLTEALERKDYQAVRDLFNEANRSVVQLRETHYRTFDKV
ncbi:MAG: prephenate dehydrogenase [Acidobacteriota bacterium]